MTLKLIHNKISMFKLILSLFIFSVIIYSPILNDKAFAAITLNWTAPTTNTDGSTLTDLAGYKIYYGNSSGNYTSAVNVGNVNNYTFSSLSDGAYYFAATAYDTSGVESSLSNEVTKTQSSSSSGSSGGSSSGTTGAAVNLLWRHDVTGQVGMWYMNGATQTGSAFLPTVTDTNWKIVGVADFNGDGKLDILWRHNVTGQVGVWYISGTTSIGSASLPTVTDTNWKIVGTK